MRNFRRHEAHARKVRAGTDKPRKCIICSQPFTPKRKDSVFCSRDCDRAWQNRKHKMRKHQEILSRPRLVCVGCGQEFIGRLRKQKFCSPICRAESKRAHRPDILCRHCGELFSPHWGGVAYCSPDCKRLGALELGRRRRLERGSYTSHAERSCPACRRAFRPRHSRQKCCSQRCWKFWYREKSRAALFGVTPEHISNLRSEQNDACAICGVPDEHHWQVFGKHLAVDHDHKCCPSRGASCGNCIRGLLCASCNLALGGYEKSGHAPAVFARYLAKYQSKAAA